MRDVPPELCRCRKGGREYCMCDASAWKYFGRGTLALTREATALRLPSLAACNISTGVSQESSYGRPNSQPFPRRSVLGRMCLLSRPLIICPNVNGPFVAPTCYPPSILVHLAKHQPPYTRSIRTSP